MRVMLLLILAPLSVFAHPGKLDDAGGHTCFTKCEQYGLSYKQYHVHRTDPEPDETPKPAPAPEPISWGWFLWAVTAFFSVCFLLLCKLVSWVDRFIQKGIRKIWPQNTNEGESGMCPGQTRVQGNGIEKQPD